MRDLALIKDRVDRDCQFLVATHSPMLLALPEATIDVFDGDTIRRTPYADLEHVQLLKAFLNDPQRFLHTSEMPWCYSQECWR